MCVNIPPNLHLPSKKKWHTCLPPPPPPPRPPRPNILMMDEDYVRMQWSCVWASPVFPCKIFVQMQAGRQTSRFGVRVRECCASKFVRKQRMLRWNNHAGFCGMALFLCDEQKRCLSCCLCTRPKLCRACLRIPICESERALGLGRGSQRARSEQSPSPAVAWGRGNNNLGRHPTASRRPRDHCAACCHIRAVRALTHFHPLSSAARPS